MSGLKISVLLSLTLLTAPLAIYPTTLSISPPPKSEAPLQSMGKYVGEIQEKWEFPSDHLPIGMTFDGTHYASWNVLYSKYMDYVIEKNSQGLSRSQIADEHVYIKDCKLTIRDQHVVDLILQMIDHPTHPKGIISLQECGPEFLAELKSRLPLNFAVVAEYQEAILINSDQFEILKVKAINSVFEQDPIRTFQDVTVQNRETNKVYRLLNAHLPGDPTKPAPLEFANYLAKTFDPNVTTIAMGDMNFNELEMGGAFIQAFPNEGERFNVYSPYCTNISPYTFRSKAIDHFMISGNGAAPILHDPETVMEGLSKTADHL